MEVKALISPAVMGDSEQVPPSSGGIHTYLSASGNEVKCGKSAELGFFSSLALFIGLVIGSGVFASTGSVYEKIGTFYGTVIIWIVAGALSLMGSFVYGELGSAIPEAGGDHVYLYRAFGPLASFLFSWAGWLSRPTIVATLSLTFAEFAYSLFVGKKNSDVPGSEIVVVAISSASITLITIYCCISKLSSKWVQNVLAVLKVGSLIFFGCTGLYYLVKNGGKLADDLLTPAELAKERESLPEDPLKFNNGITGISELCTSLYLALWGFDGWSNLNLVALEMTNPSRDLPRVMLIGVTLTTFFYLLMNVAYFSVLTSSEYIGIETVSTFADKAYGGIGKIVVLTIVTLSIFGALNSAIFCNTEVCFAAAADRFAPSIFAHVHPKLGTPIFALLFQSACALILAWSFGVNYSALVNFYSIPVWIFYASAGAALIRLRKIEPNLKRPFRANTILAYVYILVSAFMIVFSFIDALVEACVGAGFLIIGVPVWYVFVHRGYRFVKINNHVKFRPGIARTTHRKFRVSVTEPEKHAGSTAAAAVDM